MQPDSGTNARNDEEIPQMCGAIQEDRTALHEYITATEARLAALPSKAKRTGLQQQHATEILHNERRARFGFLNCHADSIYSALTKERTRSYRLKHLVALAAEHFPGLLPDASAMQAEHARILVEKEGREVDQAIFVRAMLTSKLAGPHLVQAMLQPTDRAQTLLQEFQSSGRIDLGSVTLERSGKAAMLTMQGIDNLNAENTQLVQDMEVAVDLTLLDPSIQVGVIRGGVMRHQKYAGRRVFCAGINLRDLRNGRIPLIDFFLTRELGLLNKLRCGVWSEPRGVDAINGLQKPWIAVVEAFAIGGGMQLLLVADHVIATRDAYFNLPAANEGIVPGVANLRILRFAGSRLARRIILGGQQINATDPEATLFCDRVVTSDAVEETIAAAIRDLGTSAATANRVMLGLAEETPTVFREYMAEFAMVQAVRSQSSDVLSKLERRWSLPVAS